MAGAVPSNRTMFFKLCILDPTKSFQKLLIPGPDLRPVTSEFPVGSPGISTLVVLHIPQKCTPRHSRLLFISYVSQLIPVETHIYEPVNNDSENDWPSHSQRESPFLMRHWKHPLLFCLLCCLGGQGKGGWCMLCPLFWTLTARPNPWGWTAAILSP